MKKLLYLLLLTPIIYLTSCSKSGVTPQSQSLEDIIVGTEWCLSNDNEDGFLLAEDGKFYVTQKCQSNMHVGSWELEEDIIKYKYTSSSQEITTILGEVTEYSESQIKLLSYPNASTSIVEVYIIDAVDVYGCMNAMAGNYNQNADCDDGTCDGGYVTYVPDDNFEQALINLGYDNVLDDSVLTANIDTITYLNMDNQSIADLTGIASFTALKTLYCSDNPLTSLDVSDNTNLQILICTSTFLNGLDVSKNVNLTRLNCTSGEGQNRIPNLDLSQNTALVRLSCQSAGLTNLDLSQNTALEYLSCSSNWSLTSLDLSNNTALVGLTCSDTNLKSLDIRNGNNTNMANISVYENYSLTCINVDDALWSTTNWTNIDSQQYFSTNCQ